MYFQTYSMKINLLMSVAGIGAILTLAAIIGAPYPQTVMAQSNNTQEPNAMDYTGFHSNMEQIIGHIEKAIFNKINNNETNTLGHSLHPIEEILTLVTVPITNVDSSLNKTYFDNLYQLSSLASPGNSTVEEFVDKGNSSIALSYQVISAVIPRDVLGSAEHNSSVIRDLLTIAGAEYAEGVENGKIIMELEYQDGSAFVDRAYLLFNSTQIPNASAPVVNTTNNTSITTPSLNETGPVKSQIASEFSNLASSIEQLKDPSEIDAIIQKINNNLSPEGVNVTTSSQDYINKIRELLTQVVAAYEDNDTIKAKELATTAYLDNFEFIEKPIGEELSERGESLLREKLIQQIDTNAPIEEIKQNIADINIVLDESESVLSTNQ
ncbi:conserved exported protein of unknown function [Candidatus Nitrosocosmicus franklandus]|uniref:Uncharacterized protein n=2 Tax=Candidatus Nitrosocosmicus franklandianus TaxID=1798806 RepID=A0A484I8T4_9ARCH|nr:conserved exported protein of unknown function [Candidatus Nitrosocosmicus franklandus]